MEKILHQLIGSLSHDFRRFYTSQVVGWDFFHQQYHRQVVFLSLFEPSIVAIKNPSLLSHAFLWPMNPCKKPWLHSWISFFGMIWVKMICYPTKGEKVP